ncbi:MAG: glycosyltransferase family 39 protein, partial [Anaerolineae bacterium]
MDERAARPTLARISLLAILLVSFALAAARLGYQELSGDEAFGYFFSLQSYRDIVRSTLALGEPHPVAGYFLQKAWLTAVGDGEFALRFTSAAWSLLAVALLYVLARRLALGRASALLAAMLLGISPYAIWHAQNARMYAMGLALTLASSLLVIEAMSRRRWIIWAAYVVVSWLCLQTHYYTAFVILVQNIAVVAWVLLIRRRLRELDPWVAAQLALA